LKISSTLQNFLSTLSPDPRVAIRRAIEARESARALPSVSSAGRPSRIRFCGKALTVGKPQVKLPAGRFDTRRTALFTDRWEKGEGCVTVGCTTDLVH
jgi:hypothetical protein